MKSFVLTGFSVLLLALQLCVAAPAQAIPLAPGEALRVHFSLPAAPSFPNVAAFPDLATTDVLWGLLFAYRVSGSGAPAASITLSDGNTVLGSYSLTFAVPFTTFAFSAPGGLFDFRSGIASDFSSIRDGSIDGVIDIVSESTNGAVFDFSVSNLTLGHATDVSAFVSHSPSPEITSQGLLELAPLSTSRTEVPEPAALSLLAVPLLWLCCLLYRRRPRPVAGGIA